MKIKNFEHFVCSSSDNKKKNVIHMRILKRALKHGLVLQKVHRVIRNSPPKVFLLKDVLKICSKFTRQHPCRSVILGNECCRPSRNIPERLWSKNEVLFP